MRPEALKELLDQKAEYYNQPHFIPDDPISVPHKFKIKQDIEIAGFFAAILAWGQRKSIINSALKLMELMDNEPYNFITHHTDNDLKPFEKFVHRTFNGTDVLYFIYVLSGHYSKNKSLEDMFVPAVFTNMEDTLSGFHNRFFEQPVVSERTKKHIATPQRKSACKRLNMYLRWMVRKDNMGVDFGIWSKIPPSHLICPLDVHVERIARNLGLLQRKQNDWQAAEELTANLRRFSADDPVKYDFALFGLGLENKLMVSR